jgi:peptidyl-prolyl cis-trans isomerase D
MSVLETIRNRSGLAITIVGAALILFVVSDLLQSNGYLFGTGMDNSVGEINGEKIDIRFFEQKIKENEIMYRQRQEDPSQPIDAGTLEMLREQAWQQLLSETMMTLEFEKLGIIVTIDELKDMVQGQNIHPQILSAPIFQNQQTGQFDPSLISRFFQNLNQSGDENAKQQWAQFEVAIKKEAETKKYMSLLSKGIYATTLEGKNKSKERTRVADFNMIALNFNTVPDTAVADDESALKSYFNKNQAKYTEKENSRKIEYALFDITPTADDSAYIQKWLTEKTTEFMQATDDTLFVDLNSDIRFDTNALSIGQFPEQIQSQLLNSEIGTVIGPLFENGKFKIYKVAGIKTGETYSMRASHILFRVDGPTAADTAAAVRKAQEIMAEIRRGGDFGEKAAQYGTDGTASRGGDLGWFAEGQMVKEFNDYVLKGRKGDMGIVKTQFGVHIVKVTEDKTNKLICAGVIERGIEPSEQTIRNIYNEASQFALRIADGADFDNTVTELNLSKRVAEMIRENDKSLSGMQEAREVVRWAFTSKINDVSDVISIGESKFVVAKLTGIRDKGKADFTSSRDRVLADYRNDKKADILIEKAKAEMAAKPNATIEELASSLGSFVAPVTNQNFEAANIAYVGVDNKFTGHLFGNTNNIGKITGPVRGDNAIFIYILNNINEGENLTDLTNYQDEIRNQNSQRVEYGSFDLLKELYRVEDRRFRFY